MAITINGNGTITGISVGGLPDGIVDTDMIANNAVTNAKATGIAGGKVLQVIEASSNTTVTTSSNSNEELDLLTVSITPASSSNKVLIFATFVGQATQGSNNSKGYVRVYRGSSSGTMIINFKQGSSDGGGTDSLNMTGSKLDSPSTTSAQTYTMTLSRLSSGTSSVSSDGNTYYLQALEIAA